jgi:hypothetical protein
MTERSFPKNIQTSLNVPLFFPFKNQLTGGENLRYLEKIEKISSEDRELVRNELAWAAKWVKAHYPNMTITEISRFLSEMLSVSV